MEQGEDIKPDDLVHLKNQPYPFYFKKISENNKPIVFGDFSGGQIGKKGYIESEVEWEDVIWPIPIKAEA